MQKPPVGAVAVPINVSDDPLGVPGPTNEDEADDQGPLTTALPGDQGPARPVKLANSSPLEPGAMKLIRTSPSLVPPVKLMLGEMPSLGSRSNNCSRTPVSCTVADEAAKAETAESSNAAASTGERSDIEGSQSSVPASTGS